MQSYADLGQGPESLIDRNIASDYGKLGNMFELKNKDSNMKVLEDILNNEEITAVITNEFSLEKDFDDDDFKSLLFYLGLLTIEGNDLGDVVLKVPNNVIRELYFEFFAKKLQEEIDYELKTPEIKNAIKELAKKGDNTKIVSTVERTLTKLSNRDYIQFDEKYVKLIFVTYCFLSKIYLVKSEYPVDGGGYIDVALLKQFNSEPTYFAIIELKYVSKKEYDKGGESIIEQKAEEAKKQLQDYEKSEELRNLPNLKKWVLVFLKDKCVRNLEI